MHRPRLEDLKELVAEPDDYHEHEGEVVALPAGRRSVGGGVGGVFVIGGVNVCDAQRAVLSPPPSSRRSPRSPRAPRPSFWQRDERRVEVSRNTVA